LKKIHILKKKDADILCSCTTTVEELKLFIYENMDIAPYKQNLWFEDQFLEDDKAPLIQYKVHPNGTIAIHEQMHMGSMEYIPPQVIEQGFKGSKLIGNNLSPNNQGEDKIEVNIEDNIEVDVQTIEDIIEDPIKDPVPEIGPNQWQCKNCTYVNNDYNFICDVCDAEKK